MRAHGFGVAVTTNGLGLEQPRRAAWALSTLDELTVSLDGLAPHHDEVRGSPGSHTRVLGAVEAIAAGKLRAGAGPLLRVNTILMRRSVADFPRALRAARLRRRRGDHLQPARRQQSTRVLPRPPPAARPGRRLLRPPARPPGALRRPGPGPPRRRGPTSRASAPAPAAPPSRSTTAGPGRRSGSSTRAGASPRAASPPPATGCPSPRCAPPQTSPPSPPAGSRCVRSRSSGLASTATPRRCSTSSARGRCGRSTRRSTRRSTGASLGAPRR